MCDQIAGAAPPSPVFPANNPPVSAVSGDGGPAPAANGARAFTDEAEYLSRLRTAVADVVARQRATGIDLVNDGEYGPSMGIGI